MARVRPEDTEAHRTAKAAVATELAARLANRVKGTREVFAVGKFLQRVAEGRLSSLESPYSHPTKQRLMLADSVAAVRRNARGDDTMIAALDDLADSIGAQLDAERPDGFARLVSESPNR